VSRAIRYWPQVAALLPVILATATYAGSSDLSSSMEKPDSSCNSVGGSNRLALPYGIAASADGTLIADAGNARVVRASRLGRLRTVAGTGDAGFSGDGGPARAAQLQFPTRVARTAGGALLITDNGNHRIRRVSRSGTITTVAGIGMGGFSGDGGPATSARLAFPSVAIGTTGGGVLIADNGNHRVRRVSPSGTITTVAGVGTAGFSGDGGPASQAKLNSPTSVAVIRGGFLIADKDNHRVRHVSPSGIITTVAGAGTAGFSGDGGRATMAELRSPVDVVASPAGDFLIADSGNATIRRVSRGRISTVAGTGRPGFNGDGNAAASAQLASPSGIATRRDGGIVIADTGNNRLRLVSPAGTILTLAGCGAAPSTKPTLRRTFVTLSAPSRNEWAFGLYRKPIRARRAKRIKIPYLTTRKARIAVRVRRGRRTVRRARERAAATVDRVGVRRLRPGRYSVRLRGESRGRTRRDRARLRVRR
jgi:hypothetical protein